jgi:hypothetical protein
LGKFWDSKDDENVSIVAKSAEEAKRLVEACFDYACRTIGT